MTCGVDKVQIVKYVGLKEFVEETRSGTLINTKRLRGRDSPNVDGSKGNF